MNKLSSRIKNTIIKYCNIQTSEKELENYEPVLRRINAIDYKKLSDIELENISQDFMEKVSKGNCPDELLEEAFALVKEAVQRVLGISAYDVQLLGAIAMYKGKLVEMQTGEGKTLAAVFCAYLNALSGKGVHILTFNDYLAKRDAEWMGPVYRFLGLSVGYINEGMTLEKRKMAYNSDITYITAKEAGFDYLRSFLCYSSEEVVQRPFYCAVIDEADSILIDEARVPLVIAGNMPSERDDQSELAEVVSGLKAGIDYDTDEYGRNVHLTDSGIDRIEKALGCGNIFDEENLTLLCEINSALHAEVLLKRDVDYIIRNGKVELVDEFTGRIADKRHWPEGLQKAVEAKEGLCTRLDGRIMSSITLQDFLLQYPKLCGMTATATTSADELMEFYGVDIVTIPTNKKCIRIDLPDVVFSHKDAKYKAIVKEVLLIHRTGRPVLLGTASIEESDMLAEMLREAGIHCKALNAKNDELEAEIISHAGEYGSVTVSTNMAGRGTDIRLGCGIPGSREQIAALGGLYVIGTNRHESLRIDNQLRGRAGRQGDPGSSRFFISLQDDLLSKFGIQNCLPKEYLNIKQEAPINNKVIAQRIGHIQRVVEGQNFEIRRTLRKYAFTTEEQRKVIHGWRKRVLFDLENYSLLAEKASKKYRLACNEAGEKVVKAVQKHITLFHIDKGWADYLDYTNYLREGIHLVTIAGKNPLDEFSSQAYEAFDNLKERIISEIVNTFNRIEISKDGVDFDKEGLKGPTSTWTYLISDDYYRNNPGLYMISNRNAGFAAMATAVSWPLLLFSLVYNKFKKKGR